MGHRPVASILEEWRTLDRALGEAMPESDRIDLERAVADLAEEHRDAVADHDTGAGSRRQLPALDGRTASPQP
jgi:hypothetical protein